MFGQKADETREKHVNALLEPGCEFDGKLTFQGNVQINGHFMGEIFSEGTLVVGEGALIEARIDVGNVIIFGKVIGEVDVKDRIEMRSQAEVRGNISARTLVIEEGVLFEGNCSMGTQAPCSYEGFIHPISMEKDEFQDQEVTEGVSTL